ncbi:MAG: acyl-CoA dehydrogenase family protein [Cypionkella sp.]
MAPADSLIGQEGQGWIYAKFLLGHERFNIAEIGRTKRRLERLWPIAGDMPAGEGSLANDRGFCDKITAPEIDLAALEQLGLRVTWEMDEGIQNMQSASILKLRGSRLIQFVTELSVEAMGYIGLVFHPSQDGAQVSPPAPATAQGKMEEMLFMRAATIYGGSSETQLNILANLIYAEV